MRKIKNILVVLAHGLDGAGVMRNSVALVDYVNKCRNDKYSARLISTTDISWARSKGQYSNAEELSFTEQFDEVKKTIDWSDLIIFTCTPTSKCDDKIKENFMDMLTYAKKQSKKTCMFQFEHKLRSLKNSMYTDPKYFKMFDMLDVVMTHSHTADFAVKFLQKNNIKCNLVCRNDFGLQNLFGISFDELKKFWKPFESKDYRTVKFIGRSSAWKGPFVFRDLHWKHFMKDGYISSAEGIELSIGTLADIFKQIKPSKVFRDDVNGKYIKPLKAIKAAIDADQTEFERNSPIYFMPPYNHDKAMERMSRCQFGIELLMITDAFLPDTIENAMFEIVGVGNVPVFRKKWAEAFTLDGKSIAEHGFEKTGTVVLDEEHPEEAVALMNKLSDDKEAYDKARNAAFTFYSKYFDVKPVYDKMLDVLTTKT